MPKTFKKSSKKHAWVSVAATARILGVSRQTVYARANRGELITQEIAERTVVRRNSIDTALTEMGLARAS